MKMNAKMTLHEKINIHIMTTLVGHLWDICSLLCTVHLLLTLFVWQLLIFFETCVIFFCFGEMLTFGTFA